MDSQVEILWTKLHGSPPKEYAYALTTSSDGSIYVARTAQGYLNGMVNGGMWDVFVTKYSPDGTIEWTERLATSSADRAYALTTGSDGAIYVAGHALKDTGNNTGDVAFVTKYNPDGTKAWTKLLGTSSTELASALTTGADGSIYVAGFTTGNLDGQTNNSGYDAFVAKYNPDGTKEWTKLIGSFIGGGAYANDVAQALATGLDGSIYVAGRASGNFDGQPNNGGDDAFVAKYNPDGTVAWIELFGTSSNDAVSALTTGTDGSIYVAGITEGNLDGQTNNGGSDAFVAKYNPDGTKEWTKLLGSSSNDFAQALATGADGAVIVAGYTDGNLNGQTYSGSTDAFVAVINQAPRLITSDATIAENLAEDEPVGSGEIGEDPEGDTITYSITSGNIDLDEDGSEAFKIDSSTGAITVNDAGDLDYETQNTFNLTVQASDGSLSSASTVKVKLTNLNEAPRLITSDGTIAENLARDQPVGTGVIGGDPEGDAITYSISSGNTDVDEDGNEAFKIDASTGAITVNDAGDLDYENQNTFHLTVKASDGSLSSASTVKVKLTNVNDAPILNASAPTLANVSVRQTNPAGQSVASFLGNSLSDPDGSSSQGIAVHYVSSSAGQWQYQLDGEDTWTDINSLASTADALLLRASDFVRFLPNGTAATQATLNYYGWDQSSGIAGSRIDAGDRGGITAFSTMGNTATLNVFDAVKSLTSYTLKANEYDLELTGASAINGTGNALDNLITGNAVANTLDGGAGADTLVGGDGNDIYVVDNAGDIVTETNVTPTQIDEVRSSISWTLGANLEKLTLTGTSAINGTGNLLANTLTGNAANNTLDGNGGVDTLIGGLGDDTYIVDLVSATGALQDTVTEVASAGTDTLRLRGTSTNATALTLTLAATLEHFDASNTGSSKLNLTGNTSNNILTGNAVANTLDGGAGADTMIGGAGDDTYVVDNASDVVTEEANGGTDLVRVAIATAGGTYTLGSHVENATLTNTVAYSLTGNSLNNTLTGNGVANTLNGGDGNDTLTGGGGADQFVFGSALSSTTNVDTVTDFMVGIDKLVLDDGIFARLANGFSAGNVIANTTGRAMDGNDYLVFNTTNRTLSYDADGSGSGTAVVFAALTGVNTLRYDDILVI